MSIQREARSSYRTNIDAEWRRIGVLVGKILKGAKPTHIPVEEPATLELVINLKTAKALGLTIPESLLPRADPGFLGGGLSSRVVPLAAKPQRAQKCRR